MPAPLPAQQRMFKAGAGEIRAVDLDIDVVPFACASISFLAAPAIKIAIAVGPGCLTRDVVRRQIIDIGGEHCFDFRPHRGFEEVIGDKRGYPVALIAPGRCGRRSKRAQQTDEQDGAAFCRCAVRTIRRSPPYRGGGWISSRCQAVLAQLLKNAPKRQDARRQRGVVGAASTSRVKIEWVRRPGPVNLDAGKCTLQPLFERSLTRSASVSARGPAIRSSSQSHDRVKA